MNIIWKNKDSAEIEGLLICELPPISKPKMKVKETHIDGVDGSVYEELGYESYDKTIKIGLRGNFDIDEVIDYFSGEGTLILSNESDKYYKARIIDGIDYNKLLRFRTANVKFRVQPFKYNANETQIVYDAVSEAAGNSSITLTGTIADNFKSISVYGNSIQGANPSPSNPQTITNINGSVDVEVCSKNLFDKNNVINAYLNANGTTTSDNAYRVSDYIIVKNFDNITINGNDGGSELNCFYDENKTFISYASMGTLTTKTIAVPSNAYFVRVTVKASVLNQYQLEEGSTATEYEPYQGQTLTINLGQNELCSIGDIKDELVIENGNAKIIKRIGKVVLDGSEDDIRLSANLTNTSRFAFLNVLTNGKNLSKSGLSNYFNFADNYTIDEEHFYTTTTGVYIFISNNIASTVENLKTWLSTHNTIVYFLLETSTEIDLGSVTQPTTYAGTTNVSNNKSADMKAIGYKARTLAVTNQGNYKSKPLIKLTGSGSIEYKQENVTIFSYTFPAGDTYVEIDSDKQDAYVESTLKNRNMNGEFPMLKIGINNISWTGSITDIEISNHSRWL